MDRGAPIHLRGRANFAGWKDSEITVLRRVKLA